jgi:hypothetical protein
VQAFALVASQEAVVTEQEPYLVQGIRRLRSASALASIISSNTLHRVAVSVAPDADAHSAIDVGIVAVVQLTSPFADASSTKLISPVVAVESFDAATGSRIPAIRNVVEAVFPVSASSHDARVVVNAAGQRKAERCVVYDGTRWLQSCVAGAYSSSTSSITCTCNFTASTMAVAAAEFVVDCRGVYGGSLVLDACKTCGGSVTDAAKCEPSSDSPVSTPVIIAVVSGCVVVSIAIFIYFRKRRNVSDVILAGEPPKETVIVPPSELHPVRARPFARKLQTTVSTLSSEAIVLNTRNESPERSLPGSPLKYHSPIDALSPSTSVALNHSSTPEPRLNALERYQELIARQRELLNHQTGILSARSNFERYDITRTPPRSPLQSSPAPPTSSSPSGSVQRATADSDLEKYRRILVMRQRLSLQSTGLPADSPVMSLPDPPK